jgi:hypothetical protein
MIQNLDLPPATLSRLGKIKDGLIHKVSHEQIAEQCGVTRITIERDLSKWYRTPDFYNWLHSLWTYLYRKIDNDELVFKEVTRLLGKGATQRIESYSYEKREETVNLYVSEDEDSILNKAASILDKRLQTTKKSESIH